MPHLGRGGAGNIQVVEQERARAAADVEANHPVAESSTIAPVSSEFSNREEQHYAHTGRGGAGNYYSPKALSETGQFAGATVNEDKKRRSVESQKTLGRGGLGNYAFAAVESEEVAAKRKRDDEQKRERLKQDIEKGVEEQLAMPQKAKLVGAEPC